MRAKHQMNFWGRRRLCLLTALLCCCLLTGCWDRRELDTLAIILGTGIDAADNPNDVNLTMQIAKISGAKKSGSGNEEPDEAFINMKICDKSVFHGVREMNHIYSRRPFFQHNSVIIFGKELAQQGVFKHLDFFLRDHETRMDVYLLVSKTRAQDILDIKPEIEKIPATTIETLIRNQKATSQTVGVNVLEFIQAMSTNSTAPLATMVEVIDSNGQEKISLTGMAVFNSDTMVGELNKIETRGYLWVSGKTKSGIIHIQSKNGIADIEIKSSSSDLKVRLDDESRVTVEVNVKQAGNIGALSGFEDMSLVEIMKELEEETARAIREEITASFQKAIQLNADFLGIGNQLRMHDYKKWREIETRWNEIFPTAAISIQTQTKLQSIGGVGKYTAGEGDDSQR